MKFAMSSRADTQNYGLLVPSYHDATQSLILEIPATHRSILQQYQIDDISSDFEYSLTHPQARRYGVDFSAVDYLSTAFLDELIAFRSGVAIKQGHSPASVPQNDRVGLIGIDDQIKEAFVIARLDRIMNLHDSRADFLAAARP